MEVVKGHAEQRCTQSGHCRCSQLCSAWGIMAVIILSGHLMVRFTLTTEEATSRPCSHFSYELWDTVVHNTRYILSANKLSIQT